jgi:uncharacterized membrane protein
MEHYPHLRGTIPQRCLSCHAKTPSTPFLAEFNASLTALMEALGGSIDTDDYLKKAKLLSQKAESLFTLVIRETEKRKRRRRPAMPLSVLRTY